MDAGGLYEFINTLGFPIAMVVYFIWDKNKSTKELSDQMADTTMKVVDTLNHNTMVLEKLLTKLDFDGE